MAFCALQFNPDVYVIDDRALFEKKCKRHALDTCQGEVGVLILPSAFYM